MIYESYAATNVGRIRRNNEDNYYLNGIYKKDVDILCDSACDTIKDTNGLYAVCDGMGGEEYGEQASLIAVSTLSEYQKSNFKNSVKNYTKQANKKICDLIQENNGARSGTTFVALNIDKNTATIFNVGDSRVYIQRNGKLKQLSNDHTQLQQMIDMGILSSENIRNHKSKHVLTQHFGIFEDEMIITPYIADNIKLHNGDIFLLCSDGLTDMLSDNRINQILSESNNLKQCVKNLIDEALLNGGKDNITVLIVRCRDESKKIKPIVGILMGCILAIAILFAIFYLKMESNRSIYEHQQEIEQKNLNNKNILNEPYMDSSTQDNNTKGMYEVENKYEQRHMQ